MSQILEEVKIKKKTLLSYKGFLSAKKYNEIQSFSKKLNGIAVMHINSTANGGGVAELLKSHIPLEKDLGIKSHWIVLNGEFHKDNFFSITKKIHNLLQGKDGALSAMEKKLYLAHNKRATPYLKEMIKKIKPDIIVIHDPQPLSLVDAIPKNVIKIFRLHIDLSSANKNALDFIKPFALKFDTLVVTAKEYRPKWFPKQKTEIIYPAIDPLLPKNSDLPKEEIKNIVKKYDINPSDKIISQISRFDPWKDPIGVIRAFNLAKKKIPDLKLVLIGSTADDDPEGKVIFEKVKKEVNGDPNITLITKRDGKLVNAIQTISRVVLQKSIREGFGLTVTEAMWKGKAVIGGKTIGIDLQIDNRKNGFLVSSVKQTADRVVELVDNPKLAKKIGASAHKTVQENFLTPSMVFKHLQLYKKLI